MCNFQRTIKFAINFALLCRLRRCAAHLSNKFRYSLLVSKYCSFLSNFEKHGFSKLNRLVKPVSFKIYETNILLFHFSIERRWSSRRFSYGYLVTTSPQLPAPPSTAPSKRLGHWLRAFPTPMVWRAVCTRPGNVFTATFWFAITSDSSFV